MKRTSQKYTRYTLHLALGALLLWGCGGEDEELRDPDALPGIERGACSVMTSEEEGQSVIRCPDGSSALVRDGRSGFRGEDGAPGAACVLEARSDAESVLRCPDGSEVTITSNACTIVEDGDNTLLRCADGTEANLGGVTPTMPPDEGDCEVLRGHLWIQNALDLERVARAGCVEVTGDVRVDALDLPSLQGLGTITTIGGALIIQNNSALTTLSGLEQLTSVGRDIIIVNNAELTSLAALSALGSASPLTLHQLHIAHNPKLAALQGLAQIERVHTLTIEHNDALTTLQGLDGLRALEPEGGALILRALPALTTLSALGQLSGDPAILHLEQLPALPNLQGLSELKAIGTLHVERADALTTLAGLAPSHISDQLIVRANAALTSLAGIETMNYNVLSDEPVRLGDLIIEHNPALITLDAVKVINELRGDLIVRGNASFTTWWPDYEGPSGAQRFIIDDNDALVANAAFPTMYGIQELIIMNNDALTEVGFTDLFLPMKRFVVMNNFGLVTPTMTTALNEVEELIIERNFRLTTLSWLTGERDIRSRLRVVWNLTLDVCEVKALAQPNMMGEQVSVVEQWSNNNTDAALCP